LIPIRDSTAPRGPRPVNLVLIGLNLAVFAYEVSLGRHLGHFIARYALYPADVSAWFGIGAAAPIVPVGASLYPPATLVTSAFLHAGVLHLAGNMLYLYVFGAAIEYRLGHGRFLAFYLASAIFSAVAFVAIAPSSTIPVIGASGAVAGVLGAYLVLFPHGRILALLPVFVFMHLVEVPAVLYLLLWFAVQLYSGLAEGAHAAVFGGVAWWAHVGGFLFGVAVAPFLQRDRPRRRRLWR
jgi:membrane associated rhomboid family serine protease